MKLNNRSFLAGVLVTLILCSVIAPVSAESSGKFIEVWGGVSIYVDDEKLNPKDVNGNAVDVFVYNGTTYLPVRAVSEALDKVVQWDGKTRSVYIGKHTGEKPAVLIAGLEPFVEDPFPTRTSMTDNLGNEHYNVITEDYSDPDGISATYLLNGQYSAISGTLFQNYEYKSSDGDSYIEIYGDGKLLLHESVKGGETPKSFKVDLTGVLELKIVLDIFSWYDYAGVADLGLWT